MPRRAVSIAGVSIRLTEERWQHICEEHPEIAALEADVLAAIEDPAAVLAGTRSELLACRRIADGKLVVAVYREQGGDGFVITAYVTRREASLRTRRQVWPQ